MTKILVDKLPETCSDCPLYQAPIVIPITNELSQNIPAKCSIGKKILNVGAGFRRYRTMTNDKAYCIRSNKFMDKPRTNTDCDRHEANVPLIDDDGNHREWARFDECKEYRCAEGA